VRALVVADPSQRLGVRSDGSIDYTIVRSHPFFASINWDNLHNTPPPPPAPHVSRDIIHPPPPPSDASSIPDGGVADASLSQADEERIQSDSQRYMRYLSQGERVMFCGKFKKKLLWGLFFERDRDLVLTDTPRLLYIDPATNVFKGDSWLALDHTNILLTLPPGEIPWGADLQPLPRTSTGTSSRGCSLLHQLHNTHSRLNSAFAISCPHRVYDIHGVIDAGRWIQEIQKQMDR